MDYILLLGAFAAIINLLLAMYNTHLARRRTQMQADLHEWKKEAVLIRKGKKDELKS